MGDNQKEVPSSKFDLNGDGSAMYDSDSQLRTAIIRRLLNEYRTTNYYLANAMQSTFLRFFIHDSYSTISPPEYNRPKSDNNYYEAKNNDHLKIEEINAKPQPGQSKNEYCCFDENICDLNEQRNKIIFGSTKNINFPKDKRDAFHSEFDSLSDNSQRDDSILLTGRTMHVGYNNSCYSNRSSDTDKEFQFIDTELLNNQTQQFKDIPSSVKSSDSSGDDAFYPQWKEINISNDKIQHSSGRVEKTFNDSNRSTNDKYNDTNSFDRKELNKGKSELALKDKTDDKSNNSDEYKISSRRDTKWQVFCDLYEELNNSPKNRNDDYTSSTESIKSRSKYYPRKTSSHSSSLERKINAAINSLKEPNVTKSKKSLKNNENFRLKSNNRYNKKSYIDDSSSDTEEVLIRNRYMRNKRIYKTKKYLTNKFRRTTKNRRNQSTITSSDDNTVYLPIKTTTSKGDPYKTSPRLFTQIKSGTPQFHQKYTESIPKKSIIESSHKMNNKLIHETIFEKSDEEPSPKSPFPGSFQLFMEKFNKHYELSHKKGSTNLSADRCHQESSTITCDEYSKNNHQYQSFNPNGTSCSVDAFNSNGSIDKIANSGHSTSSSLDSIDDKSVPLPCTPITATNLEGTQQKQADDEDVTTKMSASTICLKSSSGAVDSGLGTSVSEIKPIENVFIVKKTNKNEQLDEITVDHRPDAVASTEWSRICKSKLIVSKLPFTFSSSSKSKSSSENEDKIKCTPKMRVIFKREATVINLYNHMPCKKQSDLKFNEKNGLVTQNNKRRFRCLRNLLCCSKR